MDVLKIDLNVDYGKAGIDNPVKPCSFIGYIPRQYMDAEKTKHPAIIIFPGGGYAYTSPREGMPVASEYLASGYAAFILDYTVAPNGYFPAALAESFTAISYVRTHSYELNIDPERIYICGFSAGGHAAAAAGILWNHSIAAKIGFKGREHRPDAMVLCYPVITSGKYAHKESFQNLLGNKLTEENLALVSLENQVNADTPRTFIWHTASDHCVPVQNSLLLINSLVLNNVETEAHIYPRGEHGLSTARFDVLVPDRFALDPYVLKTIPTWVSDSIRFLNS